MQNGQDPEPSQIGKRAHSRLRLATAGHLTTVWGKQNVLITDLSQSGAQLETPPQGKNADCVLEWLDFEAFGTVQWQTDRGCGILFEELIPPSWLIETRDDVPKRVCADRDAARNWVAGLKV